MYPAFKTLCDRITREFEPPPDPLRRLSQTGKEYREFFFSGIYRDTEADAAAVKTFVINKFESALLSYLRQRTGIVYWRIEPEDCEDHHYSVIRYDENGPDIDYPTGKRCFNDSAWKRYSVYARVAQLPVIPAVRISR